jgi:hypothetical protein
VRRLPFFLKKTHLKFYKKKKGKHMFSYTKLSAFSVALLLTAAPMHAYAADAHQHHNHAAHTEISASNTNRAHDHGSTIEPNSIMGTHLHDKGEWMVSYRYNYMRMEGMRDGTSDMSAAQVLATTNPNAPPANFRVVPQSMNMQMHMFGAMYGVSDWLTLMGMAMYMHKGMDHTTYNMAGTTKVGNFEAASSGLGDLQGTALIRLYEDHMHKFIFGAGFSIPTGSITESDGVLTPMGTTANLRLPYAMQIGSGTYDAHPMITYTGNSKNLGWGLQYEGDIRLESKNDEGYSLGDKHAFNVWASYKINSALSLGSRLSYTDQDKIKGRDSNIAAPVPTADPNNYGGQSTDLGLFANFIPQSTDFKGHVFGIEASRPLHQDLNGPQMKQDYAMSLRWSFGF